MILSKSEISLQRILIPSNKEHTFFGNQPKRINYQFKGKKKKNCICNITLLNEASLEPLFPNFSIYQVNITKVCLRVIMMRKYKKKNNALITMYYNMRMSKLFNLKMNLTDQLKLYSSN